MIAFATAEDALNALCGNDVDPLDSGATYTDAARDRVLSELTALRAENARLREHPVVWADDATPFDGPQVAALLAENARLRSCIDAVTAATDGRIGANAAVTLTRGALRDARAALDAKEVET